MKYLTKLVGLGPASAYVSTLDVLIPTGPLALGFEILALPSIPSSRPLTPHTIKWEASFPS